MTQGRLAGRVLQCAGGRLPQYRVPAALVQEAGCLSAGGCVPQCRIPCASVQKAVCSMEEAVYSMMLEAVYSMMLEAVCSMVQEAVCSIMQVRVLDHACPCARSCRGVCSMQGVQPFNSVQGRKLSAGPSTQCTADNTAQVPQRSAGPSTHCWSVNAVLDLNAQLGRQRCAGPSI